ncbi:MAG: fibronectin type III domain-containing protein [Oscillospiraceae bacterium]|nr:fibronectin type III domain-containing protein [Oscillospiraceae bacterium]
MKSNRVLKSILCAALAAMLTVGATSVTAFAAEANTTTQSTVDATQNGDGESVEDQVKNEFEECLSMPEARVVAGFSFNLPVFSNYKIEAASPEKVTGGMITVTVPNGNDSEEPYMNNTYFIKSGDKASFYEEIKNYKQYNLTRLEDEKLEKDNIIAACTKGTDGKIRAVMWAIEDDDCKYGYSVMDLSGMTEEQAIKLIRQITAYNEFSHINGQPNLMQAEIEPLSCQNFAGGRDVFVPDEDIVVTYKGKKLVKDKDYYVFYLRNSEIGQAVLGIRPTEDSEYQGFNIASFQITSQTPANVQQSKQRATSVQLAIDAVYGADGYVIFNTDGEIPQKVATATTQNGAATIYKTIDGLEPGKTYHYFVQSFTTDENGKNWYSDASDVVAASTTDVTIPAAVKNLKQVKQTKTSAQISFSKVKGANGYFIYNANGKRIATVTTQNGAATLKKTISDLKANKSYKLTVKPYTTASNGEKVTGAGKTITVKTTK